MGERGLQGDGWMVSLSSLSLTAWPPNGLKRDLSLTYARELDSDWLKPEQRVTAGWRDSGVRDRSTHILRQRR